MAAATTVRHGRRPSPVILVLTDNAGAANRLSTFKQTDGAVVHVLHVPAIVAEDLFVQECVEIFFAQTLDNGSYIAATRSLQRGERPAVLQAIDLAYMDEGFSQTRH